MSGPISHRVILPADELRGAYNTLTRVLTLSAKGSYAAPIIQGTFIRLPSQWFGPLTFLLVGWALREGPGPAGIEFKFPFEFSTKFQLGTLQERQVTIIDFNHPLGIQIPVDHLGFAPHKPSPRPSPDDQSTPAHPTPTILETKTIITTIGTPFTIRGKSVGPGDPQKYTIDASFLPGFLTLLDAKIEGGEIIWKFEAKKLGQTQVVVTAFGAPASGAGAYWVQEAYDVHVILKDHVKDHE